MDHYLPITITFFYKPLSLCDDAVVIVLGESDEMVGESKSSVTNT